MSSFEEVKGKFFWTQAGVELLQTILQSVHDNGGRFKTAYTIAFKEAPDWFNTKDKAYFKRRYGKILLKKMKTDRNRVNQFYSQAAIDKVKEMWPRFQVSVIAKTIGKTPHGVNYIARRHMTEQEYQNRFKKNK